MCKDCEQYIPKRFASLNPFQDIRDWERPQFKEDLHPPFRDQAVLETDHDLQKPVQNLLCDVHEEALVPITTDAEWQALNPSERRLLMSIHKLINGNKRLASLLTVSALETGRLNALLLWFGLAALALSFISTVCAVIAVLR